MTFDTLLVADRGESAVRVIRTARALGLRTVAAYVGSDSPAPYVRLADEAVRLGPAPAAGPRLDTGRLLRAAGDAGAGAILPGGGALSADPVFARRCEEAGIVFVGPTPEQLELFGARHTARAAADAAGLPLAPGTEVLPSRAEALREAGHLGYPVILKATTPGRAGPGVPVCRSAAELTDAWDRARRTRSAPGGVFLERYVEQARHVEVPVFGDGEGLVVTFGDRDRSLRHRGRSVMREAPAPSLPDRVRAQLTAAARELCAWVEYRSVGTVEFVYDAAREEAYFLEVDTRFPTGHRVTEAVHGVDLLAWTLRLARGEQGVVRAPGPPDGHAVEARLYEDDPDHTHRPGPGRPPGTGTGATTSSYASSATVLAHGRDRDDALRRLGEALPGTGPHDGHRTGSGPEPVRAALSDPAFRAATHTAATLGP